MKLVNYMLYNKSVPHNSLGTENMYITQVISMGQTSHCRKTGELRSRFKDAL